MKQTNVGKLISILVLPVLVFLATGVVFAQGPPRDTPEARALDLMDLLDSIEGVDEEPPRVFKTKEGYLRFVMAPPSTHFAVEPANRGTPQEAADAFLKRWHDLLVNESPAVEFDVIRVKTSDSRSYVRYQQTYADLKIHGAQMVVQVNAAGGIVAAMSDIMRDTETLDTGFVSLNPGIDALTSQTKAIEWLASQYEPLGFEASAATLMIFSPSVVGNTGAVQLVWQTEVGNVEGPVVREFALVDAQTSEIVFHYPLIFSDKDREIYDSNNTNAIPGLLERYEGGPESDIVEVNLAYDYLGDTYDFYLTNHNRESFDGNDSTMKATVRYCPSSDPCCPWPGAWWNPWPPLYKGIYVGEV